MQVPPPGLYLPTPVSSAGAAVRCQAGVPRAWRPRQYPAHGPGDPLALFRPPPAFHSQPRSTGLQRPSSSSIPAKPTPRSRRPKSHQRHPRRQSPPWPPSTALRHLHCQWRSRRRCSVSAPRPVAYGFQCSYTSLRPPFRERGRRTTSSPSTGPRRAQNHPRLPQGETSRRW